MSDGDLTLLQNKLDEHIDEYHRHRQEEDERWDHLIVAQERNTQSIKELTEASRGLISAWTAANGAVTVLATVGRFLKWLGGFAIIIALYDYFK